MENKIGYPVALKEIRLKSWGLYYSSVFFAILSGKKTS